MSAAGPATATADTAAGAAGVADGAGTRLDLTVTAKTLIAEDVVRLTLRHPAGEELPAWTPGAHVDLLLGGDLVRQYSLCGDPADRQEWHVAVLLEPGSRGGSLLVHQELPVGSPVRVEGPRNHFSLVTAGRYLFVAGGIGITPILPMLRAAEAAGADWQLLYGGRSRDSMAFLDELAGFPGRVTVVPTGEKLDLGVLDTPRDDTAVYCCGPEGLLAAVEERCAGWPAGALHTERFRAAVPDSADERDVEVHLSRSGLTLDVPAGQSVLSAVEEAGIDVLYACAEGTCGTCETRVLSGVPEHRDHVLDEEERARGDVMMICVSRARTPRLTLDL